MTKLIRRYSLISSTYSVEHKDINKEYIVNLIEKEDNGQIVSLSISVDGEEILESGEKEEVVQKIKEYNNQK